MVDPAHDRVTVDGTPLRVKRKTLRGLEQAARVCVFAAGRAGGRRTVGNLLPRSGAIFTPWGGWITRAKD